jgi:hypothetical protein
MYTHRMGGCCIELLLRGVDNRCEVMKSRIEENCVFYLFPSILKEV